LQDGSDRFRDLKRRAPELTQLLNPGSIKTIVDTIDSNSRHEVAHPEIAHPEIVDNNMLHEAPQLERADLTLPYDDAMFGAVNR